MSGIEYAIEHDESFDGRALARVRYRVGGERNWRKFLVVLDDVTTYATVAENAEAIIAEHAGLPARAAGETPQ